MGNTNPNSSTESRAQNGQVVQEENKDSKRKTSFNADYDEMAKIILIGDTNTGKTSFVKRFVDETYDESTPATIASDFMTKKILVDGRTIKLQIWDVAGLEKLRSVIPAYYRGARGIILLYDISNKDSFLNLDRWLEQIETHAAANAKVIIIGHKSDLESSRAITKDLGQNWAEKNGYLFSEASAKSNNNVKDAFYTLIADMFDTTFESVMVANLPQISPTRIESARDKNSWKVCFVGDKSVGKSSLRYRSVTGMFEEDYDHTAFVFEYMKKPVKIDEKIINFKLYDPDFQAEESQLVPFFEGSQFVLLCYDITNLRSFQHLNSWLQTVKKDVTQECRIIVVGTKADLDTQREINYEEGEAWAKSHSCYFTEISSKEGTGINELFTYIAKEIIQLEGSEESKVTIQ